MILEFRQCDVQGKFCIRTGMSVFCYWAGWWSISESPWIWKKILIFVALLWSFSLTVHGPCAAGEDLSVFILRVKSVNCRIWRVPPYKYRGQHTTVTGCFQQTVCSASEVFLGGDLVSWGHLHGALQPYTFLPFFFPTSADFAWYYCVLPRCTRVNLSST